MGDQGGPEQTSGTATAVADKQSFAVTRRSFLIGAGAGAATAGTVLGGAVVVKNVVSPEPSTSGTKTNVSGPIPATMRRVALNIDGVNHDLVVDNRESLWETMN